MKISLIIPFYKKIAFLKLVFLGLSNQSSKNFEVIIAEDDKNPETENFIRKIREDVPFFIQHISQEDKGFRKAAILNKAIVVSKAQNIVFLDGDSIPHKHFIAQYEKSFDHNIILFGRRVMLGKQLTYRMIQNNSLSGLSFFHLVISGSTRVEDGIYFPFFTVLRKWKKRGIWGCNWGIAKQHLLEVNGFDEDYKYAGIAEDEDIEWRLIKNGLKLKSLKNKAIIYHLYHPSNYSPEEVLINRNLLAHKKEEGLIYCKNGIKK